MSLHDVIKTVLDQAKAYKFDQAERHDVAHVCRTAYLEFSSRHPKMESLNAELHAEAVARQYMREEIDKWHRRGYKNQADGAL